jgi:flavin-binding protein dodecin
MYGKKSKPSNLKYLLAPPIESSFTMSVARVTEIKASSPESFEDAIKEGIARANKTLKNVRGAWIENQEVIIDDNGHIAEYRVQMKVTFILVD